MLSEQTEGHTVTGHDADATHRQRFGLILVAGVSLVAAGVAYVGTRDAWVSADSRASSDAAATSDIASDPAWDWELPAGPNRADFQTSCLICHSARLPLSQPPFRREKWAEVVHKMVEAYGAPMTSEDESRVVDYLLAARPPGP